MIEELDKQRDEILAQIAEIEDQANAAREAAAFAPSSASRSCPSCGATVAAEYKFCPTCGTRASVQSAPTPFAPQQPAAGGRVCPDCGAVSEADNMFCMGCGAMLPELLIAQPVEEPKA